MNYRAVRRSADFRRIEVIPRRTEYRDYTQLLTQWLKTPNGTMTLRREQAWALAEMVEAGGMLAQVEVGGGKCVCGDTEVFDGQRRRRVDELVGQDFFVLTKRDDHTFGYAAAAAVQSGVKPCVVLGLANGATVSLSKDHPVFTQRGWIPVGQVQYDDLVATPRAVPAPTNATVVPDDEVILEAYLLSDGGVSQRSAHFTNTTPAVVKELTDVANRLADVNRTVGFGQKILTSQRPEVVGLVEMGYSHAAAARVLGVSQTCVSDIVRGRPPRRAKSGVRYMGGGKEYGVRGIQWFRRKWGLYGLSKDKRVPGAFWALSDRQVSLFLNRFWACDGYISGHTVETTLASERMVDDLRFMLSRLGIRSRKAYRNARCQTGVFAAWRLSMAGADALRFLEMVGPVLGKESACAKLRRVLESQKRNTNYDVVPIGPVEFRALCKEGALAFGSRTKVKQLLGISNGQRISTQKFRAFCEAWNYRGRFAWLAKTEIIWEQVVYVGDIGTQPVYDLSVPETGCFVGNGMVLHNTLMSALAPIVLGAERPLLLVPAALRDKTLKLDWPMLGKHWQLHPNLRVLSYEMLSQVKQADILERIMPDLIILDEAHKAKNRKAALTRRLVRYLEEHPWCRLVAMSGTITKRSLRDYAHLAQFALKERSPLPHRYNDLEDWADLLDEKVRIDEADRPEPGAMLVFVGSGETVREGFQRRLRETVGVVTTAASAVGTSLQVQEYQVEVPPTIVAAFSKLRATWETPGGEVVTTALDFARHAEELLRGFYYRWKWPFDKVDQEWIDARREWRSFVRKITGGGPRSVRGGPAQNFDSELQVAQACARGALVCPANEYAKWSAIRDRTKPETETVWIDQHAVETALAWMAVPQRKGIVWVKHHALLDALRARGALVFGAGENEIVTETRTCVASLAAHGTGKNLQRYNESLWLTVPTSGITWEQVIGRMHRLGQEADEVVCHVPLPCIESWLAFDQARRDAAYIEQTTGQQQRLGFADIMVSSEDDVARRALKRPADPLWCKNWPDEA